MPPIVRPGATLESPGGTSLTVVGSPAAAPLAAVDMSSLVATLQQAATAVNSLVAILSRQAGNGAAAGAATLAGGPGQGTPSPIQQGCPCCGAQGAAAGADQVGQAPPSKGASGAPDSYEKGGGANGAPEAAKTDGAGGSSKGDQLVAEAKKHLGKKYVYGAEGPDTFDCSGLMQYVAKQLGINLPRVSGDQAKAGRPVDRANLQPGDVIAFATSGGDSISHVGMFIGDGKFIHAPKPGDVVKVSSLESGYYRDAYRGARRIT